MCEGILELSHTIFHSHKSDRTSLPLIMAENLKGHMSIGHPAIRSLFTLKLSEDSGSLNYQQEDTKEAKRNKL
ncbi:unnamed protein product [Larinioides sclopetarius]|uniref:Uncharacterized protein n=1 Tax=Larinioides sclopetarius TaxID=280406 RepID=A0AAV1YYN4_9ARAC